MKVFLGGTCNGSNWREDVTPHLKIDYFNPIVPTWDKKAQLNEIKEINESDFLLFVITPLLTGFYSIAEVVDASNKKPEKTILCVLDEDNGKKWTESQKKSLTAVEKLVHSNGAHVFKSLEEIISFLNKHSQ